MKINFLLKSSFILLVTILFLNSCGKQVDAKKFPPNPKERVKKNLEEGKGFRLSSKIKGIGNQKKWKYLNGIMIKLLGAIVTCLIDIIGKIIGKKKI